MNLRNNLQKFEKHLKTNGLFYAIWRGIKYFVFLVKRKRDRFKQKPKNILTKGRMKIICSDCGINIFWNEVEVTKGMGLNTVINTLGLWTDSSKADWQILARARDYFKFKIVFKDLPISQIWTVKLEEECQIYWEVNMETEEWLHIEEFRMICMVNSRYKTWINGYQQREFPRFNNYFQNLCLDNNSTSLVGVRFPLEGKFLSSFVLECQDNEKNLLPIIQRSPITIDASIIGFRKINVEEKKDTSPGNYHLFSGRINLIEKDCLLDNKIESLRRDYLKTVMTDMTKKINSKERLKILLVNLPWQKQGKWGVRAGSRWPHMKESSEGNYLPFPFFLSYATSILRRNDIEADLIDAIAEQIPMDKFIEDLSRRNFDILVAETSVPTFYYDMELLKKISSLGIRIVLCGPQPEIYKPEFLEKNNFINFILFGEYEFSLLELIEAISHGKRDLSFIKGLIYRDDKNNVVKNLPRSPFDINLLPWPYREGLIMEKYWDLPGDIPHPSVQMVASRGCPFFCNFCLWPQILFGGRTYRTRNVIDVVDEMEYLVRKKGFKSIYFDDDTYNIGKQRILNFCDEIIKRGLNNFPWAIMAKPDLMEEEILDKMKEAGLHAVKYGIESGSQSLLDRCGKKLDLKKAEKMIKYTKSLGIKVHLTFAFGLLGETKETVRNSIDYAIRLSPQSAQFSIITPFPGTALFNELDRSGRILTRDWSLYDGHYNCVFQPENFSPDFLEQAKEYAYRMWSEYRRKKRGFLGDVKRFFVYLQQVGPSKTYRRTIDYLKYIAFDRKKYVGKL